MSMSRTSQRACAQTRLVSTAAQKRVLITGGNTGIGYVAALELAKRDYEVVLACRDAQKAQDAKLRLEAAVPGARVSTEMLDLASLTSVSACASRLLDQPVFDVVLNNAGVMACPKMSTDDGYEFQLGVNHLGHFALTSALLPSLTGAGKPVRIINVASSAHQFGKIDFGNLMREKDYQPWEAYGQSKLANVMYTYELARRMAPHPQVTVNCLHPGVVKTELGRYMVQDAWYMPAAIAVASVFFKTPEQGAQTSVYLASSNAVNVLSGKYFDDCKVISSSLASYDQAVAARLYDLSSELVAAKVPAAAAW
ncbi:hypothetical protein FOA52_002042 [Chlamydomonas sp. UWO 241]|nr:hypothetical protein FOA52_002042 [Chlamydomonas sp. UWO 241]